MTEPERVLAERYRLIEPLGQGGMGTVWRAEHVELGSKVAIKLIDAGIAESSDALGRFKREAKAAAALASAHVVQIFDYGVDNGTPYIAMELLDGESLGDRLDRTGTLSPKETLRVLTHAGFALDRAHEAGIVHRDIKPDNIFLTKGEDGEFLGKILDFGVAKAKTQDLAGAASSHTRTGALVGSPYYMSPEQVRHTKDVDHRADLWALGVIAFECLVGSRPFESEALGDLLILICTEDAPVPSERGSVPAGFDAWFAKACARKPDDRFQSAKEMVEALREVIAGEGASAGLAASEGSTKAAFTAYQQSAPDLAGTGGAHADGGCSGCRALGRTDGRRCIGRQGWDRRAASHGDGSADDDSPAYDASHDHRGPHRDGHPYREAHRT
jgi:serine/threonine-protein kinase